MKDSSKLSVNKKVLIFIIVCCTLYCLFTCIHCVLFFSKTLGDFYLVHVRNPIAGVFFKIFEGVPTFGYRFARINSLIFALSLLCVVICCIFKKLKGRNIIFNVSLTLLALAVLCIIPVNFIYQTPYTSLIDRFHMKTKINNEYQEEDLVILYDGLLNKVIEASLDFERDENGEIIYEGSLEERAIKDLLNISGDYEFLKGLYPSNYRKMMPGTNDYNGYTMGITSGFGLSIDYSNSNAILLNTITHELCHTKGLMRENEAVYCSFLAGVNSEDSLSQYAAYLEAFVRVDEAMRNVDVETEIMMIEPLLKLCLDEGFKEICEIYPKTIDSYVKGTEILEFVSYPLLDYKKYLGEIVGLLSSLQEDGGKIYIDGVEADTDYVLALIQNDSYKVLRVKFKNNKNIYNKLQGIMKEHSRLFIAIQQYDIDEISDDKTKEEYLEYYLRKFNNDNPITDVLKSILDDEYDYSRVVRLLLEYYDGQVILPYEV